MDKSLNIIYMCISQFWFQVQTYANVYHQMHVSQTLRMIMNMYEICAQFVLKSS